MINAIFMGTPDFAVESLKELLADEGINITSVVCQPDKPKGRSGKLAFPATKEFALEKGLKVHQPETLRDGAFSAILDEEKPDIIIVVAYGKILPKYILDYPRMGCINLHGSVLPKYRGSAPIQWSVINGDKTAGVTTMYMSEGLDSGDILEIFETPIGREETAGELFDRLAAEGAKLLRHTVNALAGEGITPVPQDEEKATHAPMLRKEMAEISFAQPAEKIYNLIRGMNPWPVAYTFTDKGIMKVYKATVIEKNTGKQPGERIEEKGKLIIQTADGCISLDEVQLEGKKRMNTADLLRGNDILIKK